MYGADVREEVERLAQPHVRRLDVRPSVALLRSVRRPLDGDVAFLDGGEDVVGDGLHLGRAVLDGESVDVAEFEPSTFDLAAQQVFEHPMCLRAYRRTDAVPSDHTHNDGGNRGVVDPIPLALEAFDAFELLSEHRLEAPMRQLNYTFVYQVLCSSRFNFRYHDST